MRTQPVFQGFKEIMSRRSIRTFTLDGEVQDRLDALVAGFAGLNLRSLLPVVGSLPRLSIAAFVKPLPVMPVVDAESLTAENYDTLYKKYLAAVPVAQRNHDWKTLWHAAYRWCATKTVPQKPLFDLDGLHAAIKEMQRDNRRAAWRAKQAICHRRVEASSSPVKPDKITASRLVDALLVLGMNELEERAARRDGKEKKAATAVKTTSKPSRRDAQKGRNQSADGEGRRAA